jgi:PAS domain S-box-containing protein
MNGTAEADLEPVNVLLVDDRPDNLTSLKALLTRPDYNVVLARSGPEALAQVLRQDFAVILLDVAMPGMDGFETASTIKEREQSKLIPIIFVTASVYDMEHIFRGYTVGAVDYLRKPVDPHAMRSKVEVFVELYRQRRQLARQSARLRDAEVREQTLLRARAEEALRESESLYQLTFEKAPVGIGHAGVDGRLTRVNWRLEQILGRGHGELIGNGIEELAEGEERIALAERLSRLRGGETFYSGEHLLTRGRGERVWTELTLSALHDPARDGVRQLIVVLTDIGARKEIEIERLHLVRELQDGIRARDDFMSLAAHELKTPITPLALQTANLVREIERSGATIAVEKIGRRVASVHRSAARLEELVSRILDVARLNVAEVKLELEEVDLVALIRDVVERYATEARAAGCTVTVAGERLVRGRWDRLRVEQVLQNLLANAMKYGAGGAIDVEVSLAGDESRLVVRDHGIGIPAEAQERIFERFERVAPLKHYGGFGLGLWIVRRLVEAHGGRVAVRSRPGEGAEFTIALPLAPVIEARRGERVEQGEAHP